MLAFNITVEKGWQEQLKSTSGPPVPEALEFVSSDWAWILHVCFLVWLIHSISQSHSLLSKYVEQQFDNRSITSSIVLVNESISQSAVSQWTNQSNMQSVDIVAKNKINYIRLFCRRWTCECVCDCFRRVHRRYWRNQHGMFVMLLCRGLLVSLYIAIPWNLPTQARASH